MAIFSVLICLSCASAVADNQTDSDAQGSSIIKEEKDASTDGGNSADSNKLNSQSTNVLKLNKNYKFNPGKTYIEIRSILFRGQIMVWKLYRN